MDKDKHKIEEISWATSYSPSGPRPAPPTYPTVASTAPQGQNQHAKFKGVLPDCARMYTFQQSIYLALANGKDVYATASPGGGKTLPYLCYWSQRIFDIDTLDVLDKKWNQYIPLIEKLLISPEDLPKLLILTPTRQLADQIYSEFKQHYSQILSNILHALLQRLTGQTSDQYAHLLNIIHNQLPVLSRHRFQRYENLRRMEADRANVGEDRIEQAKREIETIDTHINNYGIDGIKRITDSGNTSKKSLIAIRHGARTEGDLQTSPVIVGIYESIEKDIGKIKGNLGLVVCDESHLIQDKEIRDSSRATTIAFGLYTILKAINNDTRLCFLSGTANPSSAQNFVNYLRTCYNRRNIAVIETPDSAANASQITVHADDSINSDRSLINIMANSRTHHTVIVMFSKRKIDRLAQLALSKLRKTPLHNLSSGFKFTDTATKTPFSRYRKVSSRPEIDRERTAREAGQMEGASHIHSKEQRQYVQAGFGVIYRVDDKDRRVREKSKDNQIVADLFKKGKIKVLLSTDAIGVGVNIDVKTMYIPTIEKFHGGGFKPMEPSELSQLINRTGRGAFMYSNVVTTTPFVGPITNALSLAPRQFAKGVTIEKIPKELCAVASGFKFIWRNQIGINPL